MSGLPPGYRFEDDRTRLDREAMHAVLSQTYWSPGLPRERMDTAIEHSLCIGVFHGDAQVGFARALTDYAHFAYLADVYVLPEHGGRGIAQAMVQWLHSHPRMAGLRRWVLVTYDAHTLYEKLGYEVPDDIEHFRHRRPQDRWQ